MSDTNCSVTVIPIYDEEAALEAGFLRRPADNTFPNMLVAPGGKVEMTDGQLIEGVMYDSAEYAAVRELEEEASIAVSKDELFYFCSLTLPNGRVVISLWVSVAEKSPKLEWYNAQQIDMREDFTPGMKQEALLALVSI